MKVISIYTINTPYEQECGLMLKSALKVGLKPITLGYRNQGSWVANCAMKPKLILYLFNKFKEDLLYIDADAIFKSYPEYFNNFIGDIGLKFRGNELVSNTIFLKYNNKVKELLVRWTEEQFNNPTVWDQKILQKVLPEFSSLLVVNLPEEYAHIFDDKTYICSNPVIVQNQASRRLKKKVLL